MAELSQRAPTLSLFSVLVPTHFPFFCISASEHLTTLTVCEMYVACRELEIKEFTDADAMNVETSNMSSGIGRKQMRKEREKEGERHAARNKLDKFSRKLFPFPIFHAFTNVMNINLFEGKLALQS
jgi:hypothetical protein